MNIDYDASVPVLSEEDFLRNWEPLGYSYKAGFDVWKQITITTRIAQDAKDLPEVSVSEEEYPLSYGIINSISRLFGFYGWSRHIDTDDVVKNLDSGDDITIYNEEWNRFQAGAKASDDHDIVSRMNYLRRYINDGNKDRIDVLGKKVQLYPDFAERWFEIETSPEKALHATVIGLAPEEVKYFKAVRFRSYAWMSEYAKAWRKYDLFGMDTKIKVPKGLKQDATEILALLFRNLLDRQIPIHTINKFTSCFISDDDFVEAMTPISEISMMMEIQSVSYMSMVRMCGSDMDRLDSSAILAVSLAATDRYKGEPVSLLAASLFQTPAEAKAYLDVDIMIDINDPTPLDMDFTTAASVVKSGIPYEWVAEMDKEGVDKIIAGVMESDEYRSAAKLTAETYAETAKILFPDHGQQEMKALLSVITNNDSAVEGAR